MSIAQRGAERAGAASPRCRFLLYAAVVVLLVPVGDFTTSAHALNTCEEITRCSECVYDQTQGIMPPPLLCGWCESTHSCKQLNSTILSYYGVATDTTAGDGGPEMNGHTPADMAAFRASFCEDLRARDVNGVCPDMSCAASRTTNNIYICRPPPIIALVFGCILFVISLIVYVWMRTIRQLPWKYEPFLSDMLEGRTRSYAEHGDHGATEGEEAVAATAAERAESIGADNSKAASASPTRRTRKGPLSTTLVDSPLRDTSLPPSQSQAKEHVRHNCGDEDDDAEDGAPSTESTSTVSNPSYLGDVSHNVVLAHHPHGPTTGVAPVIVALPAAHPTPAGERDGGAAAAATGYCPICKCRQPAFLGPGEVCFWCNVARFTFVPFFIALISAVFVIVLDFAVSLKPWFSDGYFAGMLVISYASYSALGVYMVRHHSRAPRFFFESEAERKANQQVWSTTHDRPASSALSPSVPSSHNNTATPTARPSRRRHSTAANAADSAGPFPSSGRSGRHRSGLRAESAAHYDKQKLHLLNDARRSMASTYYFQLALQLRGRALLTCFPELKKYELLLESMQASPTTLTAVGDAVAVMRPAAVTSAAGSRANASPGSPYGVTLTNNSNVVAASAASHGAPTVNVSAISPFAMAMPSLESTAASAIGPSFKDGAAAAAAMAMMEGLNGIAGMSPVSVSSPSMSCVFENSRLPPLSRVAANVPRPMLRFAESGVNAVPLEEAASNAAAVAARSSPTPPVAAAGGSIVATATATAAALAATSLPESLARQKRGETVQLLSSDFLSPQYCRALKSALRRDEYITWCSKPSLRGVLMQNEWLLMDLAAGLLFGVWMVMLSSVNDSAYAIVQLSGSTSVAACGFIVMVLFAVLLIIVVRQCSRLYVLTNERLITVYESIITPVTTATDLSTVRFAALYGYRGLWSKYPCLTFSWEVPATERKMPVIKSHAFPGITHLQEFLFFFRLVAPQTPFHLQQISESTRQDRQEWRLHIFLCVGAFVALPIVTIYPQAMPDFLALYLYALGLLIIYATLLRGLRAQQMTYAPLNIAASWAPEGELSELHSVDAPQSLTPVFPPPPAPAAAAAASPPQQVAPSQQEQQQQQQAMPLFKEGVSRTVQVATPTAQPQALRTVPDLNRDTYPPTPTTTTTTTTTTATPAGSPCSTENRIVVNKSIPVAGAAVAGLSVQPPKSNHLLVSPSAGGLQSHLAKPTITVTPATTGVSPAAIAAISAVASTLQATTVPVTSAVREMEISLTGFTGVGVTGGARSAHHSSSNSAAVHVSTGGTCRDTARNSPHQQRSRCANADALPAVAAAPIAAAGNGRDTAVASTRSSTPTHQDQPNTAPGTAASSACTTPTTVGPSSGMIANLPSSSSARHLGVPRARSHLQHHPHSQQLGMGSGEDAEAASAHTDGVTPTTDDGFVSGNSGGGAAASKQRLYQASFAHVVPASARSTKPDGHTTWGDQVGGEHEQ